MRTNVEMNGAQQLAAKPPCDAGVRVDCHAKKKSLH
jgi:hypothetical protein